MRTRRDLEGCSRSPSIAEGAHADLQENLLARYKEEAGRLFGETIRHSLYMGIRDAGRVRRWLYEPVVFTWTQRNNLFRGVLTYSSATAGKIEESACQLAACTEIAWTCALIVDDIIDTSAEREGHVAAHLQYGPCRCMIAVVLALANVGWKLIVGISGSYRCRIERLLLATRFLLRCAATQFPSKCPKNFHEYRKYSADTNLCLHWILLAPYCWHRDKKKESLMRQFADHMAIAGKMRNDLLDYWGGSSEKETVFSDFHSRKISFPIFVLLEQKMDALDRFRVEGYFFRRGALMPEELMEMFQAYDVADISLDVLSRELDKVSGVLEKMKQGGLNADLEENLARLIQFTGIGCRERLSAAVMKKSKSPAGDEDRVGCGS